MASEATTQEIKDWLQGSVRRLDPAVIAKLKADLAEMNRAFEQRRRADAAYLRSIMHIPMTI